eukprot:m.531429 g.531429  ORF g.531429 m.531429 type:complete len:61 (-) comp22035_c0_seq1:1312-1494(-)
MRQDPAQPIATGANTWSSWLLQFALHAIAPTKGFFACKQIKANMTRPEEKYNNLFYLHSR